MTVMGAMESLTKQAAALLEAGDYLGAARCYKSALNHNANDAQSRLGFAKAHVDHVMSRLQQGLGFKPDALPPELGASLDIALKELQALVHDCPALAQAWGLLGVVHVNRRELPEAEHAYRKAVKLDAPNAGYMYNLGWALYKQERFAEAVEIFARVTAMNPRGPMGWHMLGEARFQVGDREAAVPAYEQTLKLAPNLMEGYGGLARAYKFLGDSSATRRVLEAAVMRRHDVQSINFSLAGELLLLKDWAPGWRYYVCRTSTQRRVPAPGDFRLEVAGKRLLMRFDQGLGDELFFLRFLPKLREMGAEVVYQTQRKLYPLLKDNTLFMSVEVAEEKKGMDYDLLVGDLPLVTQMRSDAEVPPAFRLVVDASRVNVLLDKLAAFGPPPYIGLTWKGGRPDREKSLVKEIPSAELGRSLAGLPGSFIMLQRNPTEGDVRAVEAGLGRPLLDMSGLNEDLSDMLALLSLLDDCVGVSNTNMHLLAGLGKTARVLVQNPPEWRWLDKGGESPWFPGFKVYRQALDFTWDEALAALARDMQVNSR